MASRESQAQRPRAEHFRVMRDMPELGLREGDTVSFDPDDVAAPYLIIRTAELDDATVDRAIAWSLLEPVAQPHDARSVKSQAPTRGRTLNLQLVR